MWPWRNVVIAHMSTMSATRSDSGVSEPVINARIAKTNAAPPSTLNGAEIVRLAPTEHAAIPRTRMTAAAQRWLEPIRGTSQPSCVARKASTASPVRLVATPSFRVSVMVCLLSFSSRMPDQA